jgi:probable HAF family extracellular repeat protein
MTTRLLVLVAILSLASPGTVRAQDWRCAPTAPLISTSGLGALFPEESYATGINAFGQVVGWSTVMAPEGFIDFGAGFIWMRWSGLLALASVGIPLQYPAAINLRGEIVGSAPVAGYQHVMLFAPGAGLTDLTPGAVHAWPADMNQRGEIAANFRVGSETRARYYSQATGWIDMGTFGGAYSRAHALNNRGEVVGAAQTVTGSYRAFVWSRTRGMRSLPGGEHSAAYGINDQGEIAGVRDRQAVVWRRGGQVVELGMLGEYGTESVATDINELSQVVGYARPADTEEMAFFWTAEQGMMNLGSLNPENCGSAAARINNAGRIIGWTRTASSPEPYPYKQAVLWQVALTARERVESVRAILKELRLTGRFNRRAVLELLDHLDATFASMASVESGSQKHHLLGAALAALVREGGLTAAEAKHLRALLR